jgi:hypothetical protein
MRTSVVVVMAAWLAACLAGCNGTSTGNPFDDDDEDPGETAGGHAYGNCDSDATALESADAETPLGFTAADVLAFAAGLHETTIRWQPSELASYAPESGEHALTLRVTHAGGELRYVEYREGESDGREGGELAIGTEPCSNHNAIEIDVEVEVMTDGGALDERVAGTLRASSLNWAILDVPLEADELGGAFVITETRPAGFTLVQLALEFGLSPLGLRGELDGVFEMRSNDAVSAAGGGGPIATIGADASCDQGGLPVAIDEGQNGLTGQAALDRVNQLAPVQGTWADGTSTSVTLELVHDGQSVCAIVQPNGWFGDATEPGTLRLRGVLGAQSEDGRLDAGWPVVVDASPAQGGGLGAVSIELDLEAIGPIAAADLASVTGVQGVDGSGYDSLQMSMMLALDPAAGMTGELRVQGLHFADCPMTAPTPQPGGGSGTPGCPGATFVAIASLSLSE